MQDRARFLILHTCAVRGIFFGFAHLFLARAALRQQQVSLRIHLHKSYDLAQMCDENYQHLSVLQFDERLVAKMYAGEAQPQRA